MDHAVQHRLVLNVSSVDRVSILEIGRWDELRRVLLPERGNLLWVELVVKDVVPLLDSGLQGLLSLLIVEPVPDLRSLGGVWDLAEEFPLEAFNAALLAGVITADLFI